MIFEASLQKVIHHKKREHEKKIFDKKRTPFSTFYTPLCTNIKKRDGPQYTKRKKK